MVFQPVDNAQNVFGWTLKDNGFIDTICNRATIAHYPADKLANTLAPFPPPCEQRAIAVFLDRETAKIDALVSEQERFIGLLNEKQQAVISQAVTKGLDSNVPMKDSGVEWIGEVPAHWDAAKLRYGARLKGGFAFSSDEFGSEGVPVIRMNNLRRGELDLTEAVCVPLEATSPDVAVAEGDLLWGMSGSIGASGSLGNYARVKGADIPAQVNQRVGKFVVNDEIYDSDYLSLLIQTATFYDQILLYATGTAQMNVSSPQVEAVLVPFPPKAEQKEIVKAVFAQIERNEELVRATEHMASLVKERRSGLISAAVTGKIDVRGLGLAPAVQDAA